MFKFDTMSPIGYLMPKIGINYFADEDTKTAFPEGFVRDESIAGFETVEDLVTGFKDVTTKAGTIGSLDSIEEDIRNDANIKKYANINELAKGHLENIKLVGKKGLIIPGENATEEEKNAYLKGLGRPDKSDDYKLEFADGLNKGVQSTAETQNWFKGVAHGLGLSQGQAESLYKAHNEFLSNELNRQDEIMEKARGEASTKLRAEWGPDFNTNLLLANRVVKQLGGEEATEAFGDLGNNPQVLKFLANVGKKMSEDSISLGRVSELMGTPQDAQVKIKAINEEIIKTDPNDQKYTELLKTRTKLYELAYPEGGS